MLCNSCKKLITQELQKYLIEVKRIEIGSATISFNNDEISNKNISEILQGIGFNTIKTKEEQLVDDIKIAVVEIVHLQNNVNSIIQKKDYLVEKIGVSMQTLSKVFSKYNNITLEKYIILNKIEKIKSLILSDDFTLSEIAYMMDYNSVQYLSNQFKKITGYAVSEFKQLDHPKLIAIDELLDL